ncbi:MAG: hypothetical protein QOE92_671 [Chloroflexota bacterium]|jgi:nucleoside-diphosphate-sugar epimerase|nr:hypothetical protein [Chloroflexota bacterium]
MPASRALLTGGAGFLGANLARRLVADGHEVHLLLRPGSDRWRLTGLEASLAIHEGDLADPAAVAVAVASARPRWVFHLAAHGAYSWQRDATRMVRTNVVGFANLLDATFDAGCDAVVNTGTSSEYGAGGDRPPEGQPLRPTTHYAATKATATWIAAQAAHRDGRHIPTLRPYSTYGPWEEPGRLMPTLLLRALDGGWPGLASPDSAHDFIHVDDVVDAYLLVAGARGDDPAPVYNAGTGRQTALRDLVDIVAARLDVKAAPAWGAYPDRPWDTTAWVADASRLRGLGWAPRVSLEDGVVSMAAWLAKHRDVYAARMATPPGGPGAG